MPTNLTITEANVRARGQFQHVIGTLGEAVGRAVPVYAKEDNTWWRADNNVDLDTAKATGITLCGNSTGRQAVIVSGGFMDLGAILVPTMVYVLSSDVGRIMALTELVNGERLTILGIAHEVDKFEVLINATGIIKS